VNATTLPAAAGAEMPDELDSRHLFKRLLQLSALIAVVVAFVFLLPGLSSVRSRIVHASPGWLVAAGVLELLSMVSYVVVFRAVFCPRMSWRFSFQVGMAEQAANSLLPAGGAGGLALGAWALRRGGMSGDHIARRSVAFFILTSLANVGTLIVFGAALAVGIFGRDGQPAVTLGFAAAAALAIAITLALPALGSRLGAGNGPPPTGAGRAKKIAHRSLEALTEGVHDGESLLRQRPAGILAGSFGYMGFDIATLGVCFLAFGYTPGFGVLVVGYIIGQLGGLLPLPGGIGGTEGGLIGTFALYHLPLSASVTAVLTYRAFQLWLPAIAGSIAFVQLRRSLRRHNDPAALCQPLAEPIPALPNLRG
jgi:uncharacterized membrane protein YbhN (UPF0104 family)